MPEMDEISLAKLAREMAMNIRPYKAIFADYDIDEQDYYEISKMEFFIRAKEQFTLEWNSTMSTGDRLKLQAQAGLEQMMPGLARRAMDAKESLTGATEVVKQFTRIAGIGEGKDGSKLAGERFQITINLGADVDGKPVIEKYDKSIAIDNMDIAGGEMKVVEPPKKIMETNPDKSAEDEALDAFLGMEE